MFIIIQVNTERANFDHPEILTALSTQDRTKNNNPETDKNSRWTTRTTSKTAGVPSIHCCHCEFKYLGIW